MYSIFLYLYLVTRNAQMQIEKSFTEKQPNYVGCNPNIV